MSDMLSVSEGVEVSSGNYGEPLPDECPPDNANEGELVGVFRFVPVDQPEEECFASHYALGKLKPSKLDVTECEWASCSLFSSIEAMLKMRGLRKRNPFVAKLEIPAGSGRFILEKNSHIHFWRYGAFNMKSAVVDVFRHDRS
jgi:hypothetical protein